MPNKAPEREKSGVVWTARMPAATYVFWYSLSAMRSQLRTSGTRTCRLLRKASPQLVFDAGLTHCQSVAASSLRPGGRGAEVRPGSAFRGKRSACWRSHSVVVTGLCQGFARREPAFLGGKQLRGDLMKSPRGFNFAREQFLTMPPCFVNGLRLPALFTHAELLPRPASILV
jgi:hypothetical protein